MQTTDLTIGQLAQKTGCKVPTIRYYEQVGLLAAPRRSAGNQRLFGSEHVARLVFIRHCRELGFSQSAIRGLLELTDHPDQACESVTEIARSHLHEVNDRIARLSALKVELERMIEACGGGTIRRCRIIGTLADDTYEHCASNDHRQSEPRSARS